MNSPVTNAAPASKEQFVVFPPDRGIGMLAVVAPYPPGFKPQSDGALGININMVHGDRDGLLVYILAYLNMAIGDNIKVYIETKNAPVAEFSVTDAHFDAEGNAKNIPFYISAKDMEAKFLQSENKAFWFEAERVSGNGTEESPPVPMFYKHPAPGEADIDGGKPFNQGLKLPVASESLVDQTVIDDGMFVTVLAYFNQSIGDVVVLAFGSLLLETSVTALGDVVFELTPEMLATLAPTNSLVVRWEVFDVVENSSGWSDALVLTFKPGMVLLTAPIFEQADPDNVVHHDWLVSGPMYILVTGVFAANDLIELTLEGSTKSGAPVTHTYSQTLTAASRTANFPVENEKVRNLIGGCLRASYKLIKASKTQLSKPADVTITGTSQPLGLPIIEPLVDNKLPVDSVMATVRVADYWPLRAGAKVEARWQTTDQDGVVTLFIFQLIVTDPTQPVVFQLPAKYIAPYASTPLTVQCTITNPGEVEIFSDLLQLMFGDATQIVLASPFLVPPATNPIDPLGSLPTLRVEFLAAIAEDKARLVERKAPVGTEPFPLTLLNKNKRANFVLDQKFLVAHQGTTVRLAWNLNRNGKKTASSPSEEIVINPIAPEDARLPTPRISGVSGVVDVKKLTSSNLLVVDEWPGQAEGQARFLVYEGTDTSGAVIRLVDLNGERTGTEKGLRRELPLAWLSNLKDETILYIYFWVNVNRESDKETAVQFPRQAYTVESLVELQPQITAVKDPQDREIPQGDATIATTITLHGHASIQQQVEILVNNQVRATVTTDANGNFSYALTGFTYNANNTIQLRAKYGDNLSSPTRFFILRHPLQINQANMTLNGYRVYTGWTTTGLDFIGNTEIRTASNGVEPIGYTSSNPAVASVNEIGKVTGVRNGGAYITVQDRFSTHTYYVGVSNVFSLATYRNGKSVSASVSWMNSVSGSSPVSPAFAAMQRVYGSDYNWPLSITDHWGMCEPTGCSPGYILCYSWRKGGLTCYRDSGLYWPWCLRPY